MKDAILAEKRLESRPGAVSGLKCLLLAGIMVPLGGCVQVAAPDKPIEINLNINIRQEVVVRLQEDVRDLIKKNPGVF